MHKVLIVSQDKSTLSAIKQMVMGRYDVLTADSGEAALVALRDFKSVAAIICDAHATDMPGPDFLHRATEVLPGATSILLVEASDTVAPNSDGIPSFWHEVTKPVEPAVLLALLEKSGADRTPPSSENSSEITSATIKRALKIADPDREFSLVYQPRICAKTEKTCGVEALIRWNSPEIGLIPPARFIPVSEKTNDIIWITDWTLIAACKAIRTWLDSGINPVPVTVNISPKACTDSRLVALVANALYTSKIPPDLLRLEIASAVDFLTHPSACATVEILRRLEVDVSYDGLAEDEESSTVASSLRDDYLRSGHALIGHMTDTNKSSFLETVRKIGGRLGIRTIAAGVENQQHLDFIRSIGFDQIQGFLISKPLSQTDLPGWLKVHTGALST